MQDLRKLRITIILITKDFFQTKRRVMPNEPVYLIRGIRYLALKDVLEILEYDEKSRNPQGIVFTDGSEFVTVPLKGAIGRREELTVRIDPIISDQRGNLLISFRSLNRLFNAGICLNLAKRQITLRLPALFFISYKGDTLRSISRLLNTTVRRLVTLNPNLKEPIASGINIRIPTISFSSKGRPPVTRIKQLRDIAPLIIRLGRNLRGTPYKFGAGPFRVTRKFDCSSYIQYIFGQNGVQLSRTSRAQAKLGKAILQKDLRAGELLFFRRDRYSDNRIGHVGVDIGNGMMLNTYSTPPGVTITRWRSPYWLRRYITGREIL